MPTAWVGDATLNTTYTTLVSFFYNKRHKRIPYFTIGYRNVDSRTDGIRNMNALYLSITLR